MPLALRLTDEVPATPSESRLTPARRANDSDHSRALCPLPLPETKKQRQIVTFPFATVNFILKLDQGENEKSESDLLFPDNHPLSFDYGPLSKQKGWLPTRPGTVMRPNGTRLEESYALFSTIENTMG